VYVLFKKNYRQRWRVCLIQRYFRCPFERQKVDEKASLLKNWNIQTVF